jgi:hypothetical protein
MRKDIIFGIIMSNTLKKTAEWEMVLSAAARIQQIIPDAVMAGGSAAAVYAEHRTSHDDDHLLSDLRHRFDAILTQLESVAGWETARVQRPVLILGSLDGIETGIRQLRRQEPLETKVVKCKGHSLVVPTEAEILRIKGFLILSRNATRDYVDFSALADYLKYDNVNEALKSFDRLYPQQNNQSALQQLLVQLSNPLPFDREGENLAEYTHIRPPYDDWSNVCNICSQIAVNIFNADYLS